jgi:hypothetical protein
MAQAERPSEQVGDDLGRANDRDEGRVGEVARQAKPACSTAATMPAMRSEHGEPKRGEGRYTGERGLRVERPRMKAG